MLPARQCRLVVSAIAPVCVLLTLLVAMSPVAAQGVWQSGGPEGGHVVALAADGDGKAYVALRSVPGIHRTTDGGAHWLPLDLGLGSAEFADLEVDSNGTLYVALTGAAPAPEATGVLVVRGNLRAWGQGIPWGAARALALGPGGVLLAGGGPGVFRSTDQGATWTALTDSDGPTSVVSLAAAVDGTIYAGTSFTQYGPDGGTVYVSTDGGGSWYRGQGLPERGVPSLAVSPSGVAFAGTVSAGLFRSLDRGATWHAVHGGPMDPSCGAGEETWWTWQGRMRLQALLADGARVFAGTTCGLFLSADAGNTWVTVTDGLGASGVTRLDREPSGYVLAGTSGAGVFRSPDGFHWSSTSGGLRGVRVATVVADGAARALAGTYGLGVFITSDGGASWQTINEGLTGFFVTALAIGPGEVMYVAVQQTEPTAGQSVLPNSIFRRSPGDGAWQPTAAIPIGRLVTALAVDARGTVYAAIASWTVPGDPQSVPLLRSTDGGRSWILRALPLLPFAPGPRVNAIIPLEAEALVVAGTGLYSSAFLLRSSDGGVSWSDTGVRATTVTRDPEGRLYAWGSEPGAVNAYAVFRSTDQGITWNRIGPEGSHGYYALAAGGDSLYAATSWPGQLLVAPAGGAPSWNAISFDGRSNIATLAIAPISPWRIYVGTAASGVWTLEPDGDSDTLPDVWERQVGLDARVAVGPDGPDGDPDGDGATNLDEYRRDTHPRGVFRRFFAEGAVGVFDTRFSFVNLEPQPVHAQLVFDVSDGTRSSEWVTVPAGGTASVTAEARLGGRPGVAFSTRVEADAPVVVDRYQSWDGSSGAGSHLETAMETPAPTWYFAEGATHSGFTLFYLLQNPADEAATVRIDYLRPAPALTLTKRYVLAPRSRTTLFVNDEVFDGAGRALASTDVSAVIQVESGPPIIAERSMYLGPPWASMRGGHASAGVTAPSMEWFFPEGATGAYFDLFLLLANVRSEPARVKVTYLLPDGATETRHYSVAPMSRLTVWVDDGGARLEDTAVSMHVVSENGVPIVAERAMWWPGGWPFWFEGHSSEGVTAAGTAWAFAEGRTTHDARDYETFILVANPTTRDALVRVTIIPEGAATRVVKDFIVRPTSRFNTWVNAEFPELPGGRFAATVESLPPGEGVEPTPIVVERALYANGWSGWDLGASALAVRVRE